MPNHDGQAAAAPHQVLFVLAGIWAILTIAATSAGAASPAWHGREMVFGFGGAAFAAYALTAMSSWSADNRMSRRGVLVMAVLWLLARACGLGWFGAPTALTTAAGSAFLAVVAAILSRAAWRSGRGAALALLAVLLATLQIAVAGGTALPRDGVLALALLLSVVGGRMVAAFTANAEGRGARHARHRWARGLAIPAASTICLALALAVMMPEWSRAISSLLVAAAMAEAMRLLPWQSREVWRNPLLAMLHLAYLWQPAGLALLGLSRWPGAAISSAEALHALAAGAVACSVYAVAARAVARRAETLRALPVDIAGFVLLWSAAVLRVFGPESATPVTAILWCAAWTLFLARHGAALLRAPPRPVFSGPRNARPDEPAPARHHPSDGVVRKKPWISSASERPG